MKINLHKPNIHIQIGNGIDLRHQSSPVSIRNKNESRHISRFASSLEYIAKLHTLSNNKNKVCNQTPPPERALAKGLISPNETIKIKTSTNSPTKLFETPMSLELTVITFLDSMTNLQEAILKKEPLIPLLKKEFELNKKLLLSLALSSLSKSNTKPIKMIPKRDSSLLLSSSALNERQLIEEIKRLKEEIASIKQKHPKQYNANSHSTCNINVNALNKTKSSSSSTQTEGTWLQNCFEIIKEIYSLMKDTEKNYSIDFNYEPNSTLYFNKNNNAINDDAQLLENCNLMSRELKIMIKKLSDSFDKIKANLNTTIFSLKEENKKSKAQLIEFKKVINEYLHQFHDVNSSLYSSEDLMKIFKKNYSKVLTDLHAKELKKEEVEKDLKSYKTMSDAYMQALEDSQCKVKLLEKEYKEMEAKLVNRMDSETIKSEPKHAQESYFLDQIERLKNELKESREKEQSTSFSAEIFCSISNALTKLVLEINATTKINDYIYVIFKLIGYSDEQISDVYAMKEKKRKYLTLFKAS